MAGTHTRRAFLATAGRTAAATAAAAGFPAIVPATVFGSAIRTRKEPIAPVEIAHRSCSACLLHHIGMKAQRNLFWDPVKERFKNDDAANALLSRPMRAPYTL